MQSAFPSNGKMARPRAGRAIHAGPCGSGLLVVVAEILEIGVDDVVVGRRAGRTGVGLGLGGFASACAL